MRRDPSTRWGLTWLNKRIKRWEEAVCEKAKDAESAKHAMLYLRPGLVGFRTGMLAWFLYGCEKDRRAKELVSLFVIWVASYMLNSLVAYADQIESKGKRIWFAEAFAALPEEFNAQQLREALIAVGSTARPKDVTRAWLTRNHILERTSKFAYRKT